MTLTLQPALVATGFDEEGLMVFDDRQRLVAVLTRLCDRHDEASGRWFLEAGFGCLDGPEHPTFADLQAAEAWLDRRLAKGRG
jgi:hypothetical protein